MVITLHFDYNLNIDFEDNLGLQISCINNNLEITKFILKKNSEIKIKDNNFIYEIINNDYYDITEWLYNFYPNIFKNLSYDKLYLIF